MSVRQTFIGGVLTDCTGSFMSRLTHSTNMHHHIRHAALAVTALTLTLWGTLLPASATEREGFDPGFILSDEAMHDAGAMTAAGIDTFISDKGVKCTSSSGRTCLKDYRENTPTRQPTELCHGAYKGAKDETAGAIIAKVSKACGINPQVLLVTLQKEQGLIASTEGKKAHTYSRALGFGCPDNVGGVCDSQFAGFANQVWSAASQFNKYAKYPGKYRYQAGRVNDVQFHPDADCGSAPVNIKNQATASLYNYTPYQPNAAALAAGTGEGDKCSAYGNRNFHYYFNAWFGPSTDEKPKADEPKPVEPEPEKPVEEPKPLFAAELLNFGAEPPKLQELMKPLPIFDTTSEPKDDTDSETSQPSGEPPEYSADPAQEHEKPAEDAEQASEDPLHPATQKEAQADDYETPKAKDEPQVNEPTTAEQPDSEQRLLLVIPPVLPLGTPPVLGDGPLELSAPTLPLLPQASALFVPTGEADNESKAAPEAQVADGEPTSSVSGPENDPPDAER